MKTLLKIAALLAMISAIPFVASAQSLGNIRGWCEDGNQFPVTSGLTATTAVQASYPQCIVTVYVHGGGLATIYSDGSSTPLTNPFTATTNGQWLFYVAPGDYDVTLSGGVPPLNFPSPVTYSDVMVISGGVCAAGGLSGQILYNNSGVCGGTPFYYGTSPLAETLGSTPEVSGTYNDYMLFTAITTSGLGAFWAGTVDANPFFLLGFSNPGTTGKAEIIMQPGHNYSTALGDVNIFQGIGGEDMMQMHGQLASSPTGNFLTLFNHNSMTPTWQLDINGIITAAEAPTLTIPASGLYTLNVDPTTHELTCQDPSAPGNNCLSSVVTGVSSITATSPIVASSSTGAITLSCPTCGTVTSVGATGFLSSTGGATPSISVSAVQGSDPNLLTSGVVSGAPGTPLCLDGFFGATTTGCNSTFTAFQTNSLVTMGSNITIPLTTVTAVLTSTVTMPASGGPWRCLATYNVYVTSTNRIIDSYVSDGSNKFASHEYDVSGTNYNSAEGKQMSPVTYANSTAHTFTLDLYVPSFGGGGTITATQYSQGLGSSMPASYLSVNCASSL